MSKCQSHTGSTGMYINYSILCVIVEWKVSLPVAGELELDTLEVFSNSYHSIKLQDPSFLDHQTVGRTEIIPVDPYPKVSP